MKSSSILLPTFCACILLGGCDVDKIGNRVSDTHIISGANTAKGGLSYTPAGSEKEWSHTVFTCRGSVSATGVITLRAGKSGSDLPLTVIADKAGSISLQLQAPDGLETFDRASCSNIDLKMNPQHGVVGDLTGKVTFGCAKEGKTINGSVYFNQCGK